MLGVSLDKDKLTELKRPKRQMLPLLLGVNTECERFAPLVNADELAGLMG